MFKVIDVFFKNDFLVVGYQDGSIEFIKLRKIEAKEYYLKNPSKFNIQCSLRTVH